MTDSTTTPDPTPTPRDPVRYAHFYRGCVHTNKDGTTHPGKGRLVATVATTELPDGAIAVGVARVNPSDNPVRYAGRHKARARMDRLVQSLMGGPIKETQAELLAEEMAELLAFRMDRQTFITKVIQGGVFRQMALAQDPQEARRIADDLRKSTF